MKKKHRYYKMLLIMLIKFNEITIHRIKNKAKIIIIKNYRLQNNVNIEHCV